MLLLFTMFPAGTFAQEESIESAKPVMQIGTTAISDDDNVYYGTWTEEPIAWQVLDADATNVKENNGMFLLSKYLLDSIAYEVAWNSDDGDGQAHPYDWQYSDAQEWCKAFPESAFSQAEQSALLKVSKTEGGGNYFNDSSYTGSILNEEQVFFLSIAEVYNYLSQVNGEALIATDKSGKAGYWWLRSGWVYRTSYGVGIVRSEGSVSSYYAGAGWPTRPAFNLGLDSVLFSCAAEGGKTSGAVGADGLQKIGDGEVSEWKLTMKDSDRASFTVSTDSQTSKDENYTDWSLDIQYENAKTGDNEYVSAILCDENGNALYYGNIAGNSASGTQTVNIPEGLEPGAYTLNVFSEQRNRDQETDYASDFQAIQLTVNPHVHVFDQEVETEDTLKSQATCEVAAVYYKSCQCGEISTDDADTFTSGEALGHDWSEPVWT